MRRALAIVCCSVLAALPSAAFGADQNHMLDACRAYAAKRLHVDAGIINVKYEGQRTDGTYAVNGDAETSPAITFQCSFRRDGKRIVRWVRN